MTASTRTQIPFNTIKSPQNRFKAASYHINCEIILNYAILPYASVSTMGFIFLALPYIAGRLYMVISLEAL